MRLTIEERGLVGLLLLIPLLLAIAVLENNQRGDGEQRQSASNQNENAALPLGGSITTDQHQNKRKTVEQREDEKAEIDRRVADATDELAAYTKGLFWATGLLAFGTAFLVIYAVKQSGEAIRSSEAAAQAAQAAERSATASEAALFGIETPFLYPVLEGINLKGTGDEWYDLDKILSVRFKNFGRTPAIVEYTNVGVQRYFGVPAPDDQVRDSSFIRTNEVIEAKEIGNDFRVLFGESLALQTQEDGSTKQLPIYVVGSILYGDVFGSKYITSICYYHSPGTGVFYAMGGDRHNSRRKLSADECAIVSKNTRHE